MATDKYSVDTEEGLENIKKELDLRLGYYFAKMAEIERESNWEISNEDKASQLNAYLLKIKTEQEKQNNLDPNFDLPTIASNAQGKLDLLPKDDKMFKVLINYLKYNILYKIKLLTPVYNPQSNGGKRKSRRNRKSKKSRKGKSRKNRRKSNRRR